MDQGIFPVVLFTLIAVQKVLADGGCYAETPSQVPESSGKVVFNGRLKENCTWTLPVPASKDYSLILILEGLDVWDNEKGIRKGCLLMPALYQCAPFSNFCTVVRSPTGNCNLSELDKLAATDPLCPNPGFSIPSTKNVTTIKLWPKNLELQNQTSSLSVKYKVIECFPTTTAIPEVTTTSSGLENVGSLFLATVLALVVVFSPTSDI